ncbi:MAG: MazG nucleotide pyrophosphohydrolase domain-containing protein [Candidatus Micrarchaeota archaeon]
MKKFDELEEMIAHLRGPSGCAWKRQLTLKTLPKYSKEEFQELMTAIEKEDWDNLKEELGDLMFHLLFYCQLAKEQGKFTVEDVLNEIIEKMRRRNPHIYGSVKCTDLKEIERVWEEIKQQEKKEKKEKMEKAEKIKK